MKKTLIFIAFIFLFTCGCFNQKVNQSDYAIFLSNSDSTLVSHFPKEIHTDFYNMVRRTDKNKNDIGFLVYLYHVSIDFDSLIRQMNQISIAKYDSGDSCLLIVNRFETDSSDFKSQKAIITDSSLIDKECYQGLYPIPNFIDYETSSPHSGIKLPKGYKIYLLEGKSRIPDKKYKLKENPQMPDNWKNGYSKGVAINKDEKTVIYWGIIW